ncbi:MAG: fatty acid desaturase [Myxococcota bacterium]
MNALSHPAKDWSAFGSDLDAIRRRVQAEIGAEDVAAVKRVALVSRGFELVGRGLIHFSLGPIAFGLGVVSLAIHKQLHGSEIGHAVLHGAYDKLPGAKRYQSKGYWWETPIDEQAWHEGHNIAHHQYTNIVGKDPDCRYGTIRLNEHVEHRPANHHQALHPLLIWPSFSFNMSAHFSGIVDLYTRKEGDYEVLPDRSPQSVRTAHRRWLRKLVPYYAKEYVLFPALAGPMFWKVALGNWFAEMLRSVYSAATIFTGHVGEGTASYPEGTRATSRAQWSVMQIEAANNFEVPHALSVLCGGLDKQIEHHLFPKWPPKRLRQVAPEVRALCERHGVQYRTGSWPTMLRRVFAQLRRLGRPTPATAS